MSKSSAEHWDALPETIKGAAFELFDKGGNIEAIKMLKAFTDLGLKEAKELTEHGLDVWSDEKRLQK